MSSQGRDNEKLVYMANQIGKFFVSQGEATAADNIAKHLKNFWDPRMRKAIIAYVNSGGTGLETHVLQAVKHLES